jgi:hypothetical protein
MKRTGIGLLAAAFLLLGASACSENGFKPIAVTESRAYVASCENLGDLTASPSGSNVNNTDTMTELTREARDKGANTLFLASDSAHSGTAYLCKVPSTSQTVHVTSSK